MFLPVWTVDLLRLRAHARVGGASSSGRPMPRSLPRFNLAEEWRFFPRLGLGQKIVLQPRLKSMSPQLGLGQIQRTYRGFNRGFSL